MFAQGISYAEIDEARGNSNPMTVRNAVHGIQRKLGVDTRRQLGAWATRAAACWTMTICCERGSGVTKI